MSEMENQVDLHTHTVASGHADNTTDEMVAQALQRGIKLYGITDHSMLMPGTCTEEHFWNMVSEKKEYSGIEVLYGVELNIIDYLGNVDMDAQLLEHMDLAIASIHCGIGYTPGNIKENTGAVIGAIENPYINIIGHLDDDAVPVDYQSVIDAAMENDTLLEINNNSLAGGSYRRNTRENITKILELCREYKYPVIINSDAHCVGNVGRNKEAAGLLKELEFPEELVLNYYPERIKSFLNKYKNS